MDYIYYMWPFLWKPSYKVKNIMWKSNLYIFNIDWLR